MLAWKWKRERVLQRQPYFKLRVFLNYASSRISFVSKKKEITVKVILTQKDGDHKERERREVWLSIHLTHSLGFFSELCIKQNLFHQQNGAASISWGRIRGLNLHTRARSFFFSFSPSAAHTDTGLYRVQLCGETRWRQRLFLSEVNMLKTIENDNVCTFDFFISLFLQGWKQFVTLKPGRYMFWGQA